MLEKNPKKRTNIEAILKHNFLLKSVSQNNVKGARPSLLSSCKSEEKFVTIKTN